MRDSWRLALGTLTAVPVAAPRTVDARVTRGAMLLAPVAVVPLGVLVALVLWAGPRLDLPALVTGFAAVGALALGTRAFHLDGLSDVADGLTASYDRERSLAVMKTGASGPAGTAALVVVLGGQAAALAVLAVPERGWLVAGVLVCLSRAALTLTCACGVPGARGDGIGAPYVGCVPRAATVATWVVVAGLDALLLHDLGWPWWRGVVVVAVAVLVVLALLRRAATRFGGVTGDVFGAAIEVTLLVLLAAAV